MNSLPLRLLPIYIAFFLLFTALPNALAEEKSQADGDNWLAFYYRDPRPDQLVAHLKAWSADGTLQNEDARVPLTGFLSQVFSQNTDKIQDWYSQVKDLPKYELELIKMALWLSSTEKSKQLLAKLPPEAFSDKAPPNILTLKLDSISTLDLLWGYYYATGDSKALRRIVAMFKFADTPTRFKGLPKDETPLYTILPNAAKWSLSSNAEQHPKVMHDCKAMLIGEHLNATEKKWLDESLQAAEEALKKAKTN